MRKTFVGFVAIVAVVGSVACGQRSDGSADGGLMLGSPTAPSLASHGGGGGGGGTLKETLSGAPINGVTPSGQAVADESQFSSGGSTILTVTVSNVNLPDGTQLAVSIDFKPLGFITLSGGRGSLTYNLGHFGVSRDSVEVKNNGSDILQGGAFV
ncbi:MAG TPA: hypothetical protein VNG89_14820 [Vicinamibacterales bacterium]|nr:hypothetical protein [Vicinamibacterales bacterium]